MDARALDDPALRAFLEKCLQKRFDNWPPASWDFEKLSLAAFYYHPSLAVARAQWQTAIGAKITASQRLNPTLAASPGYDFTATSIGLNPWIPGVSLDIPIETMGKRGYRQAQARHLSDSARLNIASIAWQVRGNLRSNLIEYSAARDRESLLQKQSKLQTQIVQSLEDRVKAGAASSTDLAVVQIALERTQLDLSDARRQSADTLIGVADAIGISARALAGVELDFDLAALHPAASAMLTPEVRGVALRSRADILEALADYEASQSALQFEIAKQYPDIHFGPSYQFNNGDHQFTLSVTAELPILNQNQGPIAEADARRAESAALFNALQARVITDIDRAVAAYRVTQENLALLENLAAAQKQQNEFVAAQQNAGAADKLDLLNAQNELAASQLVQLDGRIKAQQAFGALEDAVQRPIESPNASIIEQASAEAGKEKKP